MVVSCVARVLDMDVGKTLMNMEMLKFLRARASKIIPCVVFNKVIHIIQVRVCHSTDPLQMIACDYLRLV